MHNFQRITKSIILNRMSACKVKRVSLLGVYKPQLRVALMPSNSCPTQKELRSTFVGLNLIILYFDFLLFYLLCLCIKTSDFVSLWYCMPLCVSCLLIFVLIYFLVSLFVFLKKRDKERAYSCISGRQGGFWKSLGGESMIRVYCIKIFNYKKKGFASQKGTEKTTKHNCMWKIINHDANVNH